MLWIVRVCSNTFNQLDKVKVRFILFRIKSSNNVQVKFDVDLGIKCLIKKLHTQTTLAMSGLQANMTIMYLSTWAVISSGQFFT